MSWIKQFEKVFATRAAPSDEQILKQKYVEWVQANGPVYLLAKKQVPDLFELLSVIESAIGVQVKIEKESETKSKSQEK